MNRIHGIRSVSFLVFTCSVFLFCFSGSVQAVRTGFEPLLQAGRLTHLLAQFPWTFQDSPEARDRIAHIRDSFSDLTNVTVEVRHVSWQEPEAMDHLASLGVTVANLDYPLAKSSFSLRHCTVGDHAYLRLHGRNAKAWFSRGAGRDETYNYRYNNETYYCKKLGRHKYPRGLAGKALREVKRTLVQMYELKEQG